ncbi:ATP-dependent zinc metalloprotease FtsH [Cryptosporangium aurantiacum]|uniref:ATP-dependent zinc metalloprotease FtsH n=1 Tax=Cryptosporangium aurantiacum TaxID=134849 RepID=A0A1M7TUW8_9ACTN|nr:ATP-dependent zinc metalloprotease FtsH [Cryptosporangium aurantiacum]SHN74500.1 cell division protease FtsH [Cryptosporangium aurantiacum]
MTPPAKSGPPKDRPPAPAPPPPPGWRRFLIPIGIALTLILLFFPFGGMGVKSVDYGTLTEQINAKHVESLELRADGTITGTYRKSFEDGAEFESHYPTGLNGPDQAFLTAVRDPEIVPHFTATGARSSFLSILLSFAPLLLFIGYFWWIGRQAKRGAQLGGFGGMLGVGKSPAKVIDAERPETTFAEVAGYEGVKRDVTEVVDFLKNSEKYAAAGAVGPKGILMSGPPGTGKTLLARAVAGEAAVPFFAVTGSSFVELFVGVGASRVRDLFADARKRAPSIIFIDEIDAIGQRRNTGGFASNDEREQTLNQLLAEMDGFDPSTGVVVIAATNRPETLDPALLRPGRFDRQVTVPLPNQAEREAILGVHARGKHLASDVDLNATARATPGFSGADLANLLNEAAIVAVRDGRAEVSAADLSQARDRVLLGQRLGSNFLLPNEKQSVAVHESGHALVAAFSPAADPVDKVTILPSGMALGVTEQLPEAERHLYSAEQLTTTLSVQLGGRAAELVVFGQGSTGASNDLAKATDLATRMVREFGLSPKLGPVGYGNDQPQYLGVGGHDREYSEATQRVVDEEVARLLREAEARAIDLLTQHRAALDELSAQLLEHETVDGRTVHAIADRALAATA